MTQGPSTHTDHGLNRFVLMIVLLGLLLLIFNHIFGEDIMGLYYRLKVIELKGLSYLNPSYQAVQCKILNLKTVNGTTLNALVDVVDTVLRIPISMLLGGFALWAFIYANLKVHPIKHTLDSLILKLGPYWPACIPILKIPPSKSFGTDALTPQEWLQVWQHPASQDQSEDTEMATTAALTKHLGPCWETFHLLQDYQKALLILFLGCAYLDKSTLHSLKLSISQCWSPQYGFKASRRLKQMLRQVSQHLVFGHALEQVVSRHAYISTVLMASLIFARTQIGVLAPADFLWLKVVDRPLWYGLHNLGRRTFHIEALAQMSHYQMELKQGRRLSQPDFKPLLLILKDFTDATGIRKCA